LKNITCANIGKATFAAIFYTTQGNIIDIVEKSVSDLKINETRIINVEPTTNTNINIQSYCIKVVNVVVAPLPTVTGSNNIIIMGHSLVPVNENSIEEPFNTINICIRNVSGRTIAIAKFKAEFLDSEGNIIDTVWHKEYELRPNNSRTIQISTSMISKGIAQSYHVTLVKAITTDIEPLQKRAHEIRTVDAGEEVRGTIKNLSNIKRDAALIANFTDTDRK
jgi:hypothetical protein